MGDTLKGTPAESTVEVPPVILPPDYAFSEGFWNLLAPALLTGAMPTYGGAIDPGRSPTAEAAMQMARGYAQSPLPGIMGQAAGTLGGIMNRSTNPFANQWGGQLGQHANPGYGQQFNSLMGYQQQNDFRNPYGATMQQFLNPMWGREDQMITQYGNANPFANPYGASLGPFTNPNYMREFDSMRAFGADFNIGNPGQQGFNFFGGSGYGGGGGWGATPVGGGFRASQGFPYPGSRTATVSSPQPTPFSAAWRKQRF